MNETETEMERLKTRITELDNEFIKLLKERQYLARSIAELLKDNTLKDRRPLPERDHYAQLLLRNDQVFPEEALKSVLREIFGAAEAAVRTIRVAYLGPAATYTHIASRKYFGSGAEFVPAPTLGEVFELCERKDVDFGVIPIENTMGGYVTGVIDYFINTTSKVVAEEYLQVKHNLLSKSGKLKKIERIYAHPQAFTQCQQWLQKHCSQVELIHTTSNAQAAAKAAESGKVAAICSKEAMTIYNLQAIALDIQDSSDNITRFFILGHSIEGVHDHFKTSLVLSVRDRPGALYDTLEVFKKNGINMTKIESHPSKQKAWDYIFFIDFIGHKDDAAVAPILEEIASHSRFFKILGSYAMGNRFTEE